MVRKPVQNNYLIKNYKKNTNLLSVPLSNSCQCVMAYDGGDQKQESPLSQVVEVCGATLPQCPWHGTGQPGVHMQVRGGAAKY